MYFVGNNGSIVHYNGNEFVKMESGTDIDLKEIDGIDDNSIWVIGDDDGLDGGKSIVLYYNGINFVTKYYYEYNQSVIENNTAPGPYFSLWLNDNRLYISNGRGLWIENIRTNKSYLVNNIGSLNINGQTKKIKGIASNDFFEVGHFQKAKPDATPYDFCSYLLDNQKI